MFCGVVHKVVDHFLYGDFGGLLREVVFGCGEGEEGEDALREFEF